MTSRAVRLLAVCAALAAAAPGPARAQSLRWVVDGSASRIRYDSATALNAPALAGRVEWRRPSTFARLIGSVTGFEGAGWSMQSRGDMAGWLSPLPSFRLLRVELAGSGASSRHSSDFHALAARADLRVHLGGRDLGAWVGAGANVAKNSFDSTAVDGFVPSIGAWGRTGPLQVTASYVHSRVAGETFPDASMVASVSKGPLDLDAWGGVRRYPEGTTDRTETWLGATAAWWLTERIGVVLSGGQYATDLLQGLPGGDFVSIGIRVTSRRVRPVPRRFVLPFVVSAETGRERGIAFRLPEAARAEIAGDFNDWVPEPLARDGDGAWRFPAVLEPGVYRFNVRIDGERWVVPEDYPEVDDGFGDTVGLLIVSEDGA